MSDVTPRQRGPRSDAAHNDQLILETAARVLAVEPAAGIQRIADEAGVARLTVYRRYRNRDELRRAIYEKAASEVRDVVRHAHDTKVDTVAALRILIVEMARVAQRYPMTLVSDDLRPSPGDRFRPPSPPVTRTMHQAVFELIRRGQAEGALRDDIPPQLLPLVISGSLNFASRFAHSLRLDPQTVGDQVATVLLDGCTRRPR